MTQRTPTCCRFSLTQKLDCLVGIVSGCNGRNTRFAGAIGICRNARGLRHGTPSVDHHTAPLRPPPTSRGAQGTRVPGWQAQLSPFRFSELCARTGVSLKTPRTRIFPRIRHHAAALPALARLSRARRLLLAQDRDGHASPAARSPAGTSTSADSAVITARRSAISLAD